MPLRISAYRHKNWDADYFYIDFDRSLTGRTSTTTLYAPKPYEADPTDTEICQQVMKSLLSPDAGVLQVSIQNGCRLGIRRSMAMPIEDIVRRVQAAAKRAGTTAVVV